MSQYVIEHPRIPLLPYGTLYTSREERSQFVAEQFGHLWSGPVLDVGCFRRDLGRHLPEGVPYVGLDAMGEPDVQFDLESGPLPYEDNAFETVVCVDVLEHLDGIHRVFDELLRVSRSHVLVTLPNCWHGNWRGILPYGSPLSGKYYGLPQEAPPDRHRWYFNTLEGMLFLRNRAEKNGAKLVYQDLAIAHPPLVQWILRGLMGRTYWAWGPATIWAVLHK
ncbi:MAG: methyltransferase domain-containing protein [Magnetococcales bacterium]|nr:methyltransferase domain-containing protein [Magnetococcales bacterium]